MDGADISDPEMAAPPFQTSTWTRLRVSTRVRVGCRLLSAAGRRVHKYPHASGASGFHGSFFEFVRNSAFDARNYFDLRRLHTRDAFPRSVVTNSDSPMAAHLHPSSLRRA